MQPPHDFKQPTPAMQAGCELSGLEGHFSNWKEGITPTEEFLQYLDIQMGRFRKLMPHLYRNEWPCD
ncbi:hypothetical protein C4588_06840 [Candidatus Parcubacteria bacterium]|nr:MAG: hypothetical protein C4588_06840 [Candidatus Parcubacteria bacterium]